MSDFTVWQMTQTPDKGNRRSFGCLGSQGKHSRVLSALHKWYLAWWFPGKGNRRKNKESMTDTTTWAHNYREKKGVCPQKTFRMADAASIKLTEV